MKLTFLRKVNVLIYGAVSLLLCYKYFIKNKVKTPKPDFLNQRSPNKQSSVSKVDFTVKGLRALADIGLISVQNIKRRNYDVNDLEDLYNLEPSSKSEMKERVSKAVFLSSRVNFDDYTSLHYIDLGARTYSSSILWFKNHYPNFRKEFHITAFEADPLYKSEYEERPDVNFYNEAAWTQNETLYFSGKMGRVQRGGKCENGCKRDRMYAVKGIDLSEYLLNNFEPSAFVILKMDIEGSEYDVIPHMLETGAFNVIDEFFLEGHTFKLSKLKEVRKYKYEYIVNILQVIRSLGVWAHEWF